MKEFIARHSSAVIGVLKGFDRVLIRGTHRVLATAKGMMNYLWDKKVLLKDFGDYSEELTRQIVADSKQVAGDAGRPVQYLNDSSLRKEDLAREIAARDKIENGLVCVLTALEPCWSYDIHRDKAKGKLVLVSRQRRCLHHYHYLMHEELGLMHVKIQTWLPFNVRICFNGRSWLARQMDRAGIEYVQKENCFTRIADLAAAQRLFDEQLTTNWNDLLNGLAARVVPQHDRLLTFAGAPIEYYWSADQSEWATDIMFKDAPSLALVYPKLVRQGVLTLGATDVLRFLGKKLDGRYATGSATTDLKQRPQGVRLKHQAGANSVKMYDKQETVLRLETAINDPSRFKVFRGTEAEPENKKWRPLRKGVADMHRRAEVSEACNERYESHLAKIECPQTLNESLRPLGKSITRDGRRHRGLRLMASQDAQLLTAVANGQFALNGFRNGDIRQTLFGKDGDKQQAKKRSGQVSRKLGLLKAHGLIRRVPRTRRWMLTEAGKSITTLLAAAGNASATELMKIAA
ncbi:MAG TPA: hypothetical protein VFE47_11795 [Tepidisphaeraceae bacterium]|jgi:hypothetical protein|nr:hypothetical protein [Tepidisphaeraceae bacterium]